MRIVAKRQLGKRRASSRAEIADLCREPFVNVTGAALTVGWPLYREAVVDNIVALDAVGVANDLGGLVRVVAVDRPAPEQPQASAPPTSPSIRRLLMCRWSTAVGTCFSISKFRHERL